MPRDLLSTATTPMSGLVTGTQSLFERRPWQTHANFNKDLRDVEPTSTKAGSGGTTTWKIDRTIGDYVGQIQLILDLTGVAAINDTTALPVWTAANTQWTNGVAKSIIDKIELIYGGNTIESWKPLEMEADLQLKNDPFTLNHIGKLEISEDAYTSLERGFDESTLTPRVYLDMPFNFTKALNKHLPVATLAKDFTIKVTYVNFTGTGVRRLVDYLITAADDITKLELYASGDADATVVITDQLMRVEYIHVPSDEQERMLEARDSQDGLLYISEELKAQRDNQFTISSGVTAVQEWKIKLDEFNGPISELFFVIRSVNRDLDITLDQTAPATLQYNEFNFLGGDPIPGAVGELDDQVVTLDSMQITGSGKDITPQLERDYLLYNINGKLHRGDAGHNIFSYSWSVDPEDEHNASGSLEFFNISNPILVLRAHHPASIAEDTVYRVDVFGRTKNFQQLVGGDWQKVFI